MRYLFTLLIIILSIGNVTASEAITIFVKETSYSTSNTEGELTIDELEARLKSFKFSNVTLNIDYCAGPEIIVNAYVAIANSKPEVKDIRLQLSGGHKVSQCKNI